MVFVSVVLSHPWRMQMPECLLKTAFERGCSCGRNGGVRIRVAMDHICHVLEKGRASERTRRAGSVALPAGHLDHTRSHLCTSRAKYSQSNFPPFAPLFDPNATDCARHFRPSLAATFYLLRVTEIAGVGTGHAGRAREARPHREQHGPAKPG